jgi:ferrochelatase
VRSYLKEFLMDPYVIDIPYPMRWLLVHGAILPKRPAQSAEAYRKVWGERGSPLLEHLLALSSQVQAVANSDQWVIKAGMRYGNPSLTKALTEFKNEGVGEVVVFPLYPQYSMAATESSIHATRKLARKVAPGIKLRFVPAFYEDKGFIGAFAEVARASLEGFDFDHLLFSFHGLPERQIKKTDRTPGGAHCLQDASCCDRIAENNRDCYRAQSYATARALASRLDLSPDRYTVCFQSRLGRTPWIKPYTDHLYVELAAKGVKRVAVMCPAFVADCLETLEEIQIRGQEDFRKLGGSELKLIPSLNSTPAWARAVLSLAESAR